MNPNVKFLIVDDKDENLIALDGLLRRQGLELLKAKSGDAALELLLENEFALAILDVQMPRMDGFELAELMRGSQRTRQIPIIFLTAGVRDDKRRFRGYETGAVDYLYKPIEPEILQGKADVFFDLYCQRQEVTRQRDELKLAYERNAQLNDELRVLNNTLEMRVRERTAQLEDANEQLRGFTHSIAHDFRQHIRNINVNAEIAYSNLDQEQGPVQCGPQLERIRHVARLMSQMTDDLLTYSRIRNLKLHVVRMDLSAIGREIGEALHVTTYPHVQYRVQEGIEVFADRTTLRIVLQNLLDNAFKYSQKSPEPLVELGQDEQGVYVRDNGIGFDMAYSDKLFEPFERLLPSDTFSGTGMGLANVKRILDRHGGRIWVESKPGSGSTFHFTLGTALSAG